MGERREGERERRKLIEGKRRERRERKRERIRKRKRIRKRERAKERERKRKREKIEGEKLGQFAGDGEEHY